jgi:hypothetical protein
VVLLRVRRQPCLEHRGIRFDLQAFNDWEREASLRGGEGCEFVAGGEAVERGRVQRIERGRRDRNAIRSSEVD